MTQFMEFVQSAPTELLEVVADAGTQALAGSIASGDEDWDVSLWMLKVIHDEMVIRGAYAAAHDLFVKVNTIHPVLDEGWTYDEYVNLVLYGNRNPWDDAPVN